MRKPLSRNAGEGGEQSEPGEGRPAPSPRAIAPCRKRQRVRKPPASRVVPTPCRAGRDRGRSNADSVACAGGSPYKRPSPGGRRQRRRGLAQQRPRRGRDRLDLPPCLGIGQQLAAASRSAQICATTSAVGMPSMQSSRPSSRASTGSGRSVVRGRNVQSTALSGRSNSRSNGLAPILAASFSAASRARKAAIQRVARCKSDNPRSRSMGLSSRRLLACRDRAISSIQLPTVAPTSASSRTQLPTRRRTRAAGSTPRFPKGSGRRRGGLGAALPG